MKDEIKKCKVYNIKNLSQLEQIYNIFKNAGIKMYRDEFNYKSLKDYDVGSWHISSLAGLYSGSLDYAPPRSNARISFRCAVATEWIKAVDFIEKFGDNIQPAEYMKRDLILSHIRSMTLDENDRDRAGSFESIFRYFGLDLDSWDNLEELAVRLGDIGIKYVHELDEPVSINTYKKSKKWLDMYNVPDISNEDLIDMNRPFTLEMFSNRKIVQRYENQ